jgi:Glycosyl transferase family 21
MNMVATATAMATAAIGISLFSLICAVIFRRLMLVPVEVPPVPVPVALVLAATGPLTGLERLLDCLSRQTLMPARLIIAVESREDPAYCRVAALAGAYPGLHIELVVAGLSSERAQKCTNLLAALARLDASDRYIVLCDADIRPQPWWVAALVKPLVDGRADIVGGYRWQVPQSASLAGTLGSVIDRAIAVLPRPDCFRLLWGGSIALTRSTLVAIGFPTTLARALTEDLAIADRAAVLGLRVLIRRGLRLPTPLDAGLGQLWRFARRQYQILHAYRRPVWWFAVVVTAADLIARTGLIAVAIAADAGGKRVAIGSLIGLAALGSTAVEVRRSIGRRLGIAEPRGLARADHFLIWALLPAPAFHAAVAAAGFRYSTVSWAHVRYRVDKGGRVTAALHAAYPIIAR